MVAEVVHNNPLFIPSDDLMMTTIDNDDMMTTMDNDEDIREYNDDDDDESVRRQKWRLFIRYRGRRAIAAGVVTLQSTFYSIR